MPNSQLQRAVTRHHVRAASASCQYAHAARPIGSAPDAGIVTILDAVIDAIARAHRGRVNAVARV
jgi:hypothetical protein